METLSIKECVQIILQAKNIEDHLEGIALSSAIKAFGNETTVAYVNLEFYADDISVSIYEKFRGETDLLYEFSLKFNDFQSVDYLSSAMIRKLQEVKDNEKKVKEDQELQNSQEELKERYGI